MRVDVHVSGKHGRAMQVTFDGAWRNRDLARSAECSDATVDDEQISAVDHLMPSHGDQSGIAQDERAGRVVPRHGNLQRDAAESRGLTGLPFPRRLETDEQRVAYAVVRTIVTRPSEVVGAGARQRPDRFRTVRRDALTVQHDRSGHTRTRGCRHAKEVRQARIGRQRERVAPVGRDDHVARLELAPASLGQDRGDRR